MEEAFSDYQVFINHRGPDTKTTLASLLYYTLFQLGLRVFLDREELHTGNYVSPEIKAAVDSSSVRIAIFSPTYAESSWCLEELRWMLQQNYHNNIIIPIFWDVKPSDLRRVNTGPYAAAFKKHKDRGRMEIYSWEEALRTVADIKGHVFRTDEDDWGKFVYEIVDIVQEKVRRQPLMVAEHPVGLDKAAANLYSTILRQIEASGDTTIVGIVGLGGFGKTTLVSHLYNLIHSLFRRSSFLYEVSRSTSALTSLQEKLLIDMRGQPQKRIWDMTEGKSLLQHNLSGLSRVLIVLDDIDSQEQIDNLLLPVKDVLVNGSLIVITSRDKGLLERYQVSLYNMEPLDKEDAIKLFCHHAFHTTEVPTGFEDLVQELVKMCGGYPLALKVLGARLFKRPKSYWKSQFDKLRKKQFPNEMVQNIVKAYDSLEEEAKVVFPDVASFFEEPYTLVVVEIEGEAEWPLLDLIETLGQKCLVDFHCVEVCCSNRYLCKVCKIRMHSLVKDMAKTIASEERSLWLSSSENQMISSDYEISHWRLPPGFKITPFNAFPEVFYDELKFFLAFEGFNQKLPVNLEGVKIIYMSTKGLIQNLPIMTIKSRRLLN